MLAPDAEHSDAPVGQVEQSQGVHDGPDGHGFAAPGTQVVGADIDQCGREVGHQGGVIGYLAGDHDVRSSGRLVIGPPPSSDRTDEQRASTVASGAMPKADASVRKPLMPTTGVAPNRASRTSSIIWPALFSYTTTIRAPSAARSTSAAGNGQRVMGRISPTRWPAARSSATAPAASRPMVP